MEHLCQIPSMEDKVWDRVKDLQDILQFLIKHGLWIAPQMWTTAILVIAFSCSFWCFCNLHAFTTRQWVSAQLCKGLGCLYLDWVVLFFVPWCQCNLITKWSVRTQIYGCINIVSWSQVKCHWHFQWQGHLQLSCCMIYVEMQSLSWTCINSGWSCPCMARVVWHLLLWESSLWCSTCHMSSMGE